MLAIFVFFTYTQLLHASHILHNNILKPKASEMIEEMGSELLTRTGVNAYLIATNETFPERYNLVEYSKQFENNMSKPYVLFIFAPYAIITAASEERGRIGFIPSSDAVKALYDYDAVRDAAVDVIAVKDKNTPEDKHNIGVVQGYSVLADEIAASKGQEMTTTIPNETGTVIYILKAMVYIGSVFVFWIFLLKPIIRRIMHGKEE